MNISEYLLANFSGADNSRELITERDKICMEARASLLVEANFASGKFPAFLANAERFSDCYVLSPISSNERPLKMAYGNEYLYGRLVRFIKPLSAFGIQTAVRMELTADLMVGNSQEINNLILPQKGNEFQRNMARWDNQARSVVLDI